jgi:hypothetical protein
MLCLAPPLLPIDFVIIAVAPAHFITLWIQSRKAVVSEHSPLLDGGCSWWRAQRRRDVAILAITVASRGGDITDPWASTGHPTRSKPVQVSAIHINMMLHGD